jgi:nitroreductase
MDLFDAIAARHSYRGGFLDQPVPREDLRRIMAAGLAAPSGCNKQTAHLVAIDDPDVLARLRATIDPPLKRENAPAAICVLTQRVNAYRDKCFCVQDYSAAIENMLLAISALGYASCWYEGHITDDDRICDRMAQVLGVPRYYDLVCYLPVGKPVHVPRGPKKDPFEAHASFNRFGGR